MGPEAEKVDVVKEQVSASPLGEASKESQGQERNAGLVSGSPLTGSTPASWASFSNLQGCYCCL